MASSISPYATPERKAAWEKATGLKAPPDPRKPTPPPAPTPTLPVVNLSSRTYSGAPPPKSSAGSAATAPTKAPGTTPGSGVPASVTTAVRQDSPDAGRNNGAMFLQIIGTMPPETRNRYLSAFTDFMALPADQQSGYLTSLDQTAKDIVAPKIEQDRTRLKEDFDYAMAQREREKNNLQSTFDKIVGDMDFNKNRDIAKENQGAAKAMQNVANTAFVTGVAGKGILSRRSYYVRENLQNNVEDVNINYNQARGQLELKKGQSEQAIDSEIQRLYQLNDRDVSDLDQQQKQDELSVFLELAGNKFGNIGEQDRQLLEAGVDGSAEGDFAAGGDDAARKARYGREQEKKRIDAAMAAYAEKRKTEEADNGKYIQLFNLTRALQLLGRQAEIPALQAEMDRIRPGISNTIAEARAGYFLNPDDQQYAQYGLEPRRFFGNSGSGIGDLGDFERRWEEQFYQSNNLLYQGMNETARQKLNELVKGNAGLISSLQK